MTEVSEACPIAARAALLIEALAKAGHGEQQDADDQLGAATIEGMTTSLSVDLLRPPHVSTIDDDLREPIVESVSSLSVSVKELVSLASQNGGVVPFNHEPAAQESMEHARNRADSVRARVVHAQKMSILRRYRASCPLDETQLRARAIDSDTTKVVNSLLERKAKIDKLRESSKPLSGVQLDTVGALLVEISNLYAQVSNAEIPESVEAFLAAAQSDGATLGQLNDEVRRWIEDGGHSGRIRIRWS